MWYRRFSDPEYNDHCGLLNVHDRVDEYFSKNSVENENRSVMVKIISQNDAEIRDRIIRSTNNQTAIESKSLFATSTKRKGKRG